MANKKRAGGASALTKPESGSSRNKTYADRTANKTSKTLTTAEKAFRRRFVLRYLKMGNATDAYWGLKPHLKRSAASTQASEMMREDYTSEIFEEELKRLEETERDDRAKIKFLLFREANHYGGDATHGGRVAALGRLAKIHGMEIEKERNPKNPVDHSGVMLVPFAASLEEWQQLAAGQQKALKDEVRK